MNTLNQSITTYRFRDSFLKNVGSFKFSDQMSSLAFDLTTALQRFSEAEDLKIEFHCSEKGVFAFIISRESEAASVLKEQGKALLHSCTGRGEITK